MTTIIRTNALLMLLALFGITQIASAQSIADDVERAGNVEYVSGGIGIEEQQQLNAFARNEGYNLKLVFTLNAGNYLSDIDVQLRDRQGATVLRDVSDGPFFVAKVPQGSYTVTATHDGQSRSRTIRVGSDAMRTAYFRWPAGPDTGITFPGGSRARMAAARSRRCNYAYRRSLPTNRIWQ